MLFDVCFRGFSDTTILTTQDGEQSILQMQLSYLLKSCRNFEAGNFVVKQSNAKYNQVDPDQSQEWLNATGKKGGGIVGITRTPTALSM